VNTTSLINRIFSINSDSDFRNIALQVFRYQAANNLVYRSFINYLGLNPQRINEIEKIPFLPIELFKLHRIVTGEPTIEVVFESSGTTGTTCSRHFIADLSVYEQSFLHTFKLFYGEPSNYTILALLPSYLERRASSLIYMTDILIKKSAKPESGFYLYNTNELIDTLLSLERQKRKTLLIGVTYALLDLAEQHKMQLKYATIMETGGMKGRRRELTRAELHEALTGSFGVTEIHSEYGMTELLSQAYSKQNGVYENPAWMRILIRDIYDPFQLIPTGRSGGINIIDLANIHSCCFIETADIGRITDTGGFEVLGRYDSGDVRGCNLLVQ